MNVVGIIQARMSSIRFPGKVMKALDGEPMLGCLLSRILRCRSLHKVVIATSQHMSDDCIESFAINCSIPVFRGSLNDVLDRYYQCAAHYYADVIVRITADNPLTDPDVVDWAVTQHIASGAGYTIAKNQPGIPRGCGVEVLSMSSLKWTWRHATDDYDREHVSTFMNRNPEHFLTNVCHRSELIDEASVSVTVDHEADLQNIQSLCIKVNKRAVDIRVEDILTKSWTVERMRWEAVDA